MRGEVKREVVAGLTTFFTMAYILVVNPAILSAAGVPKEGALFATAVASAVATFLMGVYAGLPFALAPGMGLNAYFAYTVCGQMGVDWRTALTAVFIEGVIFLIGALFGARRAILRAIPKNLAYGISAGIGLFITLIGLKNAGIVVPSQATLVRLGNLKSPEVLITIAALAVSAVLIKKKVPGALLIGIFTATALGILAGKGELPKELFGFPEPTAAFQLDLEAVFNLTIVPVVLTFLLVDVFDTVGTLSALCARLGIPLTDERVGRALTCDAAGTTVGGLLGTSTVTTYIESAAGVAAGGRTGLTAITVAVLFLLSLFLYPLFSAVPAFATSPTLILVGYYMAQSAKEVEWENFTEAFPAFLTMVLIPLTFSISDGLIAGFAAYGFLKAVDRLLKE